MDWYEEHLTALAEYMEFVPKDEQKLWELIAHRLESDTVATKEEQMMWESVRKQEDAQILSGRPEHSQETMATGPGISRMTEMIQEAYDYQCELQMIAMLQEAVERLSREELRRRKGTLLRDYNNCQERRQQQKDQLTGLLNQMVRKEAFAEDFYRKPIEAMLSLTDHAGQVLRQLHTTLQSYESLMEKLEVDISLVEKEKEKIVELLEDYVKELNSKGYDVVVAALDGN